MADFRVKAAGFSHVGMKRKQNQDSFLLVPELDLFIVADGMGGHKGGEIASKLAVDTIAEHFRNMVKAIGKGKGDPQENLYEALTFANAAINSKADTDATLQGMGTTCTTFHFCGGKLYIGQVGDSRGYLVHPNRIWQITRDHSLVQEKLRAGMITREQLKTDKMKNVITRSVGFEQEVDVDVYQLEPKKGDVFVACSDGLSGMVDDIMIRDIVSKHACQGDELQTAAIKLIEEANTNGGEDNVTAIVVKVL